MTIQIIDNSKFCKLNMLKIKNIFMKNFSIAFVLLCLPFVTLSQTKKVLGSQVYCEKTFNYEFNQSSNGLYSFSIDIINEEADENRSVTKCIFNEFKQETFIDLCEKMLKEKIKVCEDNKQLENLKNIATNIFFEVKTNFNSNDDEPITAYLKLKSAKIRCYYSDKPRIRVSKSDFHRINQEFRVHNVSVEFEDGVIKNLFADLFPIDNTTGKSLTSLPIRFKNTVPISVSSRNDYDDFKNYKIFASNTEGINDIFFIKQEGEKSESIFQMLKNIFKKQNSSLWPVSLERTSKEEDSLRIENSNIFFTLPDLIQFVEVLESGKEDYSPKDCVEELNLNNSIAALKKIRRSEILTIKAFTDFVGVENEKPNGLIQFEASKKFLLNTRKDGFDKLYMGFFNYVEPEVLFSKIEENNKYLHLTKDDLDTRSLEFNKKVFLINPIDLLRHQKFSYDLGVNVYKINIPDIKSNIQLNVSIGNTQVTTIDSIKVVENQPMAAQQSFVRDFSSIRWGGSFNWEIKSDGRYGINFGYDFREYKILNEDYLKSSRLDMTIHTFWVEAFLRTNSNNTLFFRHRFSFGNPMTDDNFVQLQLGYSTNLFKPTIE